MLTFDVRNHIYKNKHITKLLMRPLWVEQLGIEIRVVVD